MLKAILLFVVAFWALMGFWEYYIAKQIGLIIS